MPKSQKLSFTNKNDKTPLNLIILALQKTIYIQYNRSTTLRESVL